MLPDLGDLGSVEKRGQPASQTTVTRGYMDEGKEDEGPGLFSEQEGTSLGPGLCQIILKLFREQCCFIHKASG